MLSTPMKVINFSSFLIYYFGLLIRVALNIHRTPHPIGIKWRWQHWKKVNHIR